MKIKKVTDSMRWDCKVCGGRTNQRIKIATVYFPICWKCEKAIRDRSPGAKIEEE